MALVHRIEKKEGQEGPDLMIFCPACQCGHGIWTTSKSMSGGGWQFNGNFEKPTFIPSLKVTYKKHVPPVTAENLEEYQRKPWTQTEKIDICHSVITDGVINFCSDCTHELAGKSVPMVDF